ncbi:MAG: DHH family phosphoesterase [Rickettsiales bacterium]
MYCEIENSYSTRLFKEKKLDNQIIQELQFCYNINYFLAALLNLKNINQIDAKNFLEPKIKNHFPSINFFLDIEKGINRTINAILNKEKICIFGDYDADGSCGAALLYKFFKSINIITSVYIPDRLKEGYGLNFNAIKKIKEINCSLIITVDCGTTAIDEIEFANSCEIDTIVLDHHFCDKVPNAVAVINPNRIDQKSGYEYLCGAGVAFIFIAILIKKLEDINFFSINNIEKINLLDLTDLVAVATIADVVPLVGLNRAFITFALNNTIKYKKNIGLNAIFNLLNASKINSSTIAFQIAPRLNASGRIGDSNLSMLLLSSNKEEETKIIADQLNLYNLQRKDIEAKIMQDAEIFYKKQIKQEDKFIFIGSQNWHSGVIGIIASKIKEQYNKVTIIYSISTNSDDINLSNNNLEQLNKDNVCNNKLNNEDLTNKELNNKDLFTKNLDQLNNQDYICKASARSNSIIDIGKIITNAKVQNLILTGGGHKAAGGFSFLYSKKQDISKFINAEIIKQEENKQVEIYEYMYLPDEAVNIDNAKELLKLEPFGSHNREPIFKIKNAKIKNFIQLKEKIFKMQIQLENNNICDGILFDAKDIAKYITNKEKFNLIVNLQINDYTGKLQLNIQDILL